MPKICLLPFLTSKHIFSWEKGLTGYQWFSDIYSAEIPGKTMMKQIWGQESKKLRDGTGQKS